MPWADNSTIHAQLCEALGVVDAGLAVVSLSFAARLLLLKKRALVIQVLEALDVVAGAVPLHLLAESV